MEYLLMIYAEETAYSSLATEDTAKMMADYGKFTQDIIAAGQYKAGARLRPVTEATSVRVRDGKNLVTDGPFAETREQLGGYYLIEAANLDDAIAIAARIPGARVGTIEVRPLWPTPAPAQN